MAQKAKQTQKVAPSVRRAQVRVQWAWYVSLLHGVLLLTLGVHLLTRDDPAWVLGVLCLAGTILAPLLGRATYRGSAISALLLLASVVAPPVVAFLTGRSLGLPSVGLPLAVGYYLGVKGATGLRGKRSGRRRGAAKGAGKGAGKGGPQAADPGARGGAGASGEKSRTGRRSRRKGGHRK